MHIAMISDLETSGGGAAIAATRLAGGFFKEGHRVTRIVLIRDQVNSPWTTIALPQPSSVVFRGARKLLPADWKMRLNRNHWSRSLRKLLQELRPDVINLHNLHGGQKFGWGTNIVEESTRSAPTVWTLHDLWSFTGRCTYNFDCEKYLTGCDQDCPTYDQYPSMEPVRIANAWRKKKDLLLRSSNLAAATPSQWLADLARNAFWKNRRVKVIRNALPLEVFRPVSQMAARQALDLDPGGIVVLLVSSTLDDPRKANRIAIDAISKIADKKLTVLTMGKGTLADAKTGLHIKDLGHVDQDDLKVQAYAAASFLLHPAMMENFPNVVAESISCGTPVVAFNTGGLPEMVRFGETGWLSSTGVDALAETLAAALKELRSGLDLRQSCRRFAEAQYGIELQVQSYTELFEELQHQRTA